MKIAIVTFYGVSNYGAMLQSYALWKYLESHGHEVVFVQQRRFTIKRLSLFKCLLSRTLRGARSKLLNNSRWAMSSFASKYPQTMFCRTLDDVRQATADYDAFVVGSDQVWNPVWWKSADDLPIAMLDFAPEGKPRISYAVSFGNKDWPTPENMRQVGECLKKFTKISVREQSGIDLVRSLSGRSDAICLLDPTLLHTAEFYQKEIIGESARCPAGRASPYIFRYILGWDDEAFSNQALERVKGKLEISQVQSVGVLARDIKTFVRRFVCGRISVPEWVASVHGATFVFTDSFHGTVFSILFHKPFVTLLLRGEMRGMNERVLSLLGILGLSERAVYADEVEKWLPIVTKPIDWDDVEKRLALCREKTDGFLDFK